MKQESPDSSEGATMISTKVEKCVKRDLKTGVLSFLQVAVLNLLYFYPMVTNVMFVNMER